MGMKLGLVPLSLAILGKSGLRVCLIFAASATFVERCCKNSLRRLAIADRIGPRNKVATASKTGPKSTLSPLGITESPLLELPRPSPSAIPPTTALMIPPPTDKNRFL